MERAWRHLRLMVQIATRLNRGALIHGGAAYLLFKSRAGTKKL
jgi:hypothetical protein